MTDRETMRDFIFGGSRITADGDCSHEIQRCLLHLRKTVTYLDNILKSRGITFLTKVHLVRAMVFPVVMYGCESWTIKKVEHWRIDAFELGYWRRLLRVRWTGRRSNQSILREISPEYSLEGLMLKLKLQYFGHPIRRADSMAKTLMLRKIEGRRRRGQQRMRWLEGITDSIYASLSKLGSWWWTGQLVCCSPGGCKELDMTEWLNWTWFLQCYIDCLIVYLVYVLGFFSFFHIVSFWSHSVLVGKDAWYDFTVFKFTGAVFVAQHVFKQRMFHLHMRRTCILLLDGMVYG